MRSGTRGDLPAGLETLRRRFDRWRRSRKRGSPTPDRLWEPAVQAAGVYGLNRTATALRVNYCALNKQVERAASGGDLPAETGTASRGASDGSVVATDGRAMATFLELAPPASRNAGECILELENPGGAKLRIHLKGVEVPDLVALSRDFWGVGP